jgi:hypothetical protein
MSVENLENIQNFIGSINYLGYNSNYTKSQKTRIYPLRTSANKWKIKLYSKHICNDECKLAYIEEDFGDNSSIMFIVDNPDYKNGKCSYSFTLNPSVIKLSTFDLSNPNTIDGELLFENNIVIPDKKIYLNISFPLKDSKKISIESKNPLGFSLANIINTIKNVYKWIYDEEENTCSEKKYTLLSPCECLVVDGKNKFQHCRNSIESIEYENCPICFENNVNCSTNCNHKYHSECIDKWILQGNNKCPICREMLFKCNICSGKEIIYVEYTGKVVPKEMRGMMLGRNRTDGIFGIYGHDFEDLFLEYMVYDNVTKTLYPKISA